MNVLGLDLRRDHRGGHDARAEQTHGLDIAVRPDGELWRGHAAVGGFRGQTDAFTTAEDAAAALDEALGEIGVALFAITADARRDGR